MNKSQVDAWRSPSEEYEDYIDKLHASIEALEQAVLKSCRNTEFYGPSGDDQSTGCYHCTATWPFGEPAHTPECIVTTIAQKQG